jgi:hypothetical protein
LAQRITPDGQVRGGASACGGLRQLRNLPLLQAAHARTLNRADMDKYVLAAVIGLREAEACLVVKTISRFIGGLSFERKAQLGRTHDAASSFEI